MTTRQQLTEAAEYAREMVDANRGDLAVMRYAEILSANRVNVHRWDDDLIVVSTNWGGDAEIVTVRWSPNWAPGPRYHVFDVDGTDHPFTTPFGAGLYVAKGEDIAARPESYLITVWRPGHPPEEDPYEVVGLERAVERYVEEYILTTNHQPVASKDVVRRWVRHAGHATTRGYTPDGVIYEHKIERL